MSHSLIVSSSDPEARVSPFGLNATELTLEPCPTSVWRTSPLATSHSLIVLSSDPEARVPPFGLNVTELTLEPCPRSV